MKHLISRRDLLKQSVLLPVAATFTVPPAPASAAFAPVRRIGGAHLKLALNAFSFLELLNENAKDATKGVDLFGVCDFAAKQNLEAVDLTGYFFPGYPKPPSDSYVNRIKRHTHSLGLAISGTGVRNDFTTADKTVRTAGVELIKTWIEVAARLGAPTVRVFADSQPPFKTWQEASGGATHAAVETWMADDLRLCAEHGEKFGVIVAVQNHGDFIRTGAEHLSLLQRVDHEWCAALVDTGKYMTDDPYADIALMVPQAVNWQIKETLRSRTDSPRTDFQRLVKIIRDGGYRGYVPVETLSMRRKDYDPFAEVAKVVAELRTAIKAAQ
jgi:sugar phosphate isomerase/epimerase